MKPQELEAEVRQVFDRHGLSFDELTREASEVVVFGSRAVSHQGDGSDWDLLLVGPGRSIHQRGLDVVVVPEDEVSGGRWLRSELASHVAAYGVWLKGSGAWSDDATPDGSSAALKARKLEPQLRTFLRLQDQLSPERRLKHRRRLRRNLQRLNMLHQGLAMPTNAELDAQWRSMDPAQRLALAENSSSFFSENLSHLWELVLAERQGRGDAV